MTVHDWSQTAWSDGKGCVKTINDVLVELKDIKPIMVKISDLSHIPSVHIDKQRKELVDLSFPVIIQKINGRYFRILDGHHRRQKAIDLNKQSILAKIYVGELFNESR